MYNLNKKNLVLNAEHKVLSYLIASYLLAFSQGAVRNRIYGCVAKMVKASNGT
jgi:hypothetical protein